MRIYAQTPARRTRQVLADLLAIAVIVGAAWFARLVHRTIMLLVGPGQAAQSAGNRLAGGLHDAGNAASRVPLVGGALKQPLLDAAEAGTGLVLAGQAAEHTVSRLAFMIAFVLVAVPVVTVLLLWLPPRIRWLRSSSQAQRLLAAPGGADLFALRALTGPLQDLAGLRTADGGLAAAWRRGDREVIDDLARVGLRRVGLQPPR
jgi:hypothetical protein